MKIILIILSIFIWNNEILAQNENSLYYPYAPNTKYQYDGPVIKVKEFYYNTKGGSKRIINRGFAKTKYLRRTLKFDKNGMIAYLLNEPRPIYNNIEEDSRLVSKRRNKEFRFYYFQDGRLKQIKVVDKMSNEKDSFVVNYSYPNDSLISVEFKKLDECYSSQRILNANGHVTSYFRGNPSKWEIAYKFKYKNELLVKTQVYRGGIKRESYESEYDQNGDKLFGWAFNSLGDVDYEAIYKIRQRGNVRKIVSRSITFDRLKSYRNRNMTYEIFDDYGNLIKRISTNGRLFKSWSVDEFEIEYTK